MCKHFTDFPTTATRTLIKKPRKGADGHRRQSARLVAAYLQSQSETSSLGQRRDKTQWVLVISTFGELRSHVTANWGRNSEIWLRKAVVYRSHTIVSTHQLSAPRQNSGGGTRRKVQFSELQMVSDLDLDLGMDQVASVSPMHIGLPAGSTEIWPLEIRVISTLREV